MSYTIAFDVPEADDLYVSGVWFPSSTATLTPALDEATRFDTEAEAEAFMASPDVPFSLRSFGAVVEVGSE